jgi:hypothetical protein
MSQLVRFPGPPWADMPPETVLRGAIEAGVTPAVVVGLDGDGKLYVAASLGDADEVLGLLARASTWLATQANEA